MIADELSTAVSAFSTGGCQQLAMQTTYMVTLNLVVRGMCEPQSKCALDFDVYDISRSLCRPTKVQVLSTSYVTSTNIKHCSLNTS